MGQPVRTIRGKGYPTVPTGTYYATLRDIQDEIGQYGPRFKWIWDVDVPGQVESYELRQWTNQTTTAGAEAGKIVKAMTGRVLPKGEDLDVDPLIGRRVILDVVLDDENDRNVVEAVRPAPNLAASPAPSSTPRAPEPGLDPGITDDQLSSFGA